MDCTTMETALGPRNNSGCPSTFGSVNVPLMVLVMMILYTAAQLGANKKGWEQGRRWVGMAQSSLGDRASYIRGEMKRRGWDSHL